MSFRHGKNKKTGIPNRWLDYCSIGKRIPGTRFIAFKVPLKSSLNLLVPKSEAFGLKDLLDEVERQEQELGMIIDLTFTSRYYTIADVPQSCSHIKIFTEGHKVPSDNKILKFKQVVRGFLKENRNNDKLIGVHCTHGLNRTGYLVCRYLIDVDGVDPSTALKLFNTSRGHCIERKNYLHDLQYAAKRSNDGIDKPGDVPIRGLAVVRPPFRAEREMQRSHGSSIKKERQPSGSVTTGEKKVKKKKKKIQKEHKSHSSQKEYSHTSKK